MADPSTSTSKSSILDHLDHITIISLLSVLTLLQVAYLASQKLLPRSAPSPIRILFIWHLFDFLIHTIFEGSFLYNCFFTSAPFDASIHHPAASITNFLNTPDRLYGARYGDNWATKLWMVYAQADRRWGGADVTVISLELLTVLGAGPLAAYICYGLVKRKIDVPFWTIVLATAELYGGFMTFAPEWLTGSQNLDTSNFMFLWVYLFFFNFLWVVFPVYALWVSYKNIHSAMTVRNIVALKDIEQRRKELAEKTQ